MRFVKGLLAIAVFWFTATACKKHVSDDHHQQKALIEELGFKTYTIMAASNTPAMSFTSIEEAKEYVKPFLRRDTITTNLKLNYRLAPKVTLDYVMRYIRSRLSVERVTENGEGWGPSYPDNGGWVNPYDSEAIDEDGNPCEYGNPVAKKWVGWAGHFASFTYTRNPSGNYTTSGFDSGLMGLTIGVSWDHGQGSATPTLDANGMLVVTVTGTQNYNLIVEGIGTVFRQPVKITVKINPCTGVYSMTVDNV